MKVILVSNIVDGYPSEFENFSSFLALDKKIEVLTISNPLERRSLPYLVKTHYRDGQIVTKSSRWRPNIPPITYLLDALVGIRKPTNDIWIGFNPLNALLGTLRWRKTSMVVFWGIDFVPQKSRILLVDFVYRVLEKLMMRRIDLQIENSAMALHARQLRSRTRPEEMMIVPITMSQKDYLPPDLGRIANKKIVYFGSLDERNGMKFLTKLISEYCRADLEVSFDVIGDGPLRKSMTHDLDEFIRERRVRVYGYVGEIDSIRTILGKCSIAIAPFEESPESFTRFADPQKIKHYLAASLPIFMTPVPPNAEELAREAGSTLISQSAGTENWIKQIQSMLEDSSQYQLCSISAFNYAMQFERSKSYESIFEYLLTSATKRSS